MFFFLLPVNPRFQVGLRLLRLLPNQALNGALGLLFRLQNFVPNVVRYVIDIENNLLAIFVYSLHEAILFVVLVKLELLLILVNVVN